MLAAGMSLVVVNSSRLANLSVLQMSLTFKIPWVIKLNDIMIIVKIEFANKNSCSASVGFRIILLNFNDCQVNIMSW